MILTQILTLFILNAHSCQLELYERVLLIKNSSLNEKDFVARNSDCPEKTISELVALLKDQDGEISGRHISKILPEVSIQIQSVQIIQLESLVASRFLNSPDMRFRTTSFDGPSSVPLERNESIDLSCSSCTSPGNRGVFIRVMKEGEKVKQFWAQGKTEKLVEALIVKSDLNQVGEPLKEENVLIKKIWSDSPQEIFTDKNNIGYYQSTRPLERDRAIETRDLIKSYLVQSGQVAKITIKDSGLYIEATGIPLRSGKLGETIQLRNPKTQRIFLGKVVGINTLEAQL